MNCMKSNFLAILLLAGTMAAGAQGAAYDEEDNDSFPHMFIGLQGGVQNTFNSEFNNLKTFTPTLSLSLGRYFTPVVGARIGINGAWSKSGVAYLNRSDGHYRYNYITPSADVLVNLCTLFGKKSAYPVNLIFVGGLGANYAFENYYRSEEAAPGSNMLHADNDSRWAFNGRVGLALDIPLHRAVSFNLEADLNGRAIGKKDVFNNDPLQLTLQAGFNFKFGYGHKKASPVQAEDKDLTLYDQMVQDVDQRMDVWMKRLKGESQADYRARTTGEAAEVQRMEYTKLVSTDMAGNRANTHVSNIRYNPGAQKLGVEFTDMPSISLNVPASEVQDFNPNSGLKFTNTVYNLNPGDKFEVLYTDVLNPVTGKTYTYVNTRDAQFVQTDGYMPLATAQQEMLSGQRLQAVPSQSASAQTTTAPGTAAQRVASADTVWYDDVTYKDVPTPEKLSKTIFYGIGESTVDAANPEVAAVADFVKGHKNCKVVVTGHADKETGSPAYNMNLSRQRAEQVAQRLIAAGVQAKAITKQAKGDTVQPFSENDRNRAVIIEATGDTTKRERVVTRKFRIADAKK